MIHVAGRRADKALLLLLCLGGKRGLECTAFSMLLGRRPTALQHDMLCSRALSSTAGEAVAEPAQAMGAASVAAGSSRQLSKAVVVARGKARLFW